MEVHILWMCCHEKRLTRFTFVSFQTFMAFIQILNNMLLMFFSIQLHLMRPEAYMYKERRPNYSPYNLCAIFAVISNHMQKLYEVKRLTSPRFLIMSSWINVSAKLINLNVKSLSLFVNGL